MKKLILNALPVSQNAMIKTKDNLFIKILPNGWKLYGKTGTIYHPPVGWFVGFIQKGNQVNIFVTNTIRPEFIKMNQVGNQARPITESLLKNFIIN